MELTIFTKKTSARLEYILDVFFTQWWGLSVSICTDPDIFRSKEGPKLSYGRVFQAGEVSVPAVDLLFQEDISPIPLNQTEVAGYPAWFPTKDPAYSWPFDIFSLAFYHLSRYEEYMSGEKDKYGRFPAKASPFFETLDIPLVDHWHFHFGKHLKSYFPELKLRAIPFRELVTYDIDKVRAYAWRPVANNILGLGKQIITGRWGYLPERIRVMQGLQRDPYDVFRDLEKVHESVDKDIRYFILLGDYGGPDRAISPKSFLFKQLVNRLDQYAGVSLHSSVKAAQDRTVFSEEKQALESMLGRPVRANRQHFLHFRLPEQYRMYAEAGIKNDYSLGFADQTGFRAGTSRVFPWFDLKANQVSNMRIHPFQVMDVTLRHYMKLRPEQAIDKIMYLRKQVRTYGGTFTSIWHNSSFHRAAGWGPWESVHAALLE